MGCHGRRTHKVWVYFTDLEKRYRGDADLRLALDHRFTTFDRSPSVVAEAFEKRDPEPGEYLIVVDGSNCESDVPPHCFKVVVEPVPVPRVKVSLV